MNSSFSEIVCPFENKWKFHKADLFALKDLEDGCLRGKCYYAYNIPGLQYYVVIYPNGDSEENRRGETWAFLYINGTDEGKISAEFTLSVESANFSKNLNYVYEEIVGLGEDKICKIDEFFDPKYNFFVNGEITIKVKGIFKSPRPLISKICTPISMQWKIKEEDLRKSIKKESNDAILYSKRTQFIYEEYRGYGQILCTTADLFDPSKKYFVDGYLTINLNGILMAEKSQLFTNTKNDIEPKFNLKILAAKSVIDTKDFKILIGEKEIPVHKKLLMNVSPVLKGMFESGMKESIENTMIIKDFEFKIIEAAIELLYGTNVIKEFTFEEMLLLYRFGDKYEIKHISDLVEGYLIKEISPSNVVQLIKFSSPDALNVKKLHQKCIDFFIKSSKESEPVYGSEALDEKLLASILLSTMCCHFCPNVDTDISV